jgi:hypothetical protein
VEDGISAKYVQVNIYIPFRLCVLAAWQRSKLQIPSSKQTQSSKSQKLIAPRELFGT